MVRSAAEPQTFGKLGASRVARADRPANALDEVAAWRRWAGPALAGGVLTSELVDFCRSGLSIVLASCDGTGRPIVGRGLACRFDDLVRMRVVLRRPGNRGLIDALESGGRLAATFTKPATHRSIQLKAEGAMVVELEFSDAPAAMAQTSAFRHELVDVGYPEVFAAAYTAFEPHELVALDVLPDQIFVQTPGPGAGSALRP